MNNVVVVNEFLTEQKLINCLKQAFGENNVFSSVRVCEERRFRWDAKVLLEDKTIFVEFDGDSHYRDPKVIKRDREKEDIAKNNNSKVIRIPYWIQLNNETFLYYFNKKISIEQNYRHGFVSDKAALPASFCELGINKFKLEFDALSENIKFEIVKSLKEKIEKYGEHYVLPTSLKYILSI